MSKKGLKKHKPHRFSKRSQQRHQVALVISLVSPLAISGPVGVLVHISLPQNFQEPAECKVGREGWGVFVGPNEDGGVSVAGVR